MGMAGPLAMAASLEVTNARNPPRVEMQDANSRERI
jgi:hypothetical protein